MNKTAVEWLVEQLNIPYEDMIHIAKEMEKQQIIEAYTSGDDNGIKSMIDNGFECIAALQYYNETFKK